MANTFDYKKYKGIQKTQLKSTNSRSMLSRHSTLLTWSALFDLLIAFEYFTKLKKWYFLFSYPPISCKKKLYFISPSKFLQFWFDHKLLVQLAYMVLITNCQGLLYIGIINSIELVSSSARVTSAKFHKVLGRRYVHRDP